MKKALYKTKLALLILSSFVIFLSLAPVAQAVELPCTPSSGAEAQNDVFKCVDRLYRFGLVAATIAAVFMIILAGYLYIFSGGSESRVGTAKSFISTSLIGLAVLVVGYLILQQINPDILNVKNISPGSIDPTAIINPNFGSGGRLSGGSGPTPTGQGPIGGGQAGNVTGKDGKTVCNGGRDTRGGSVNCSCYPNEVKAAASEFGVEPALLFAILQQETMCGKGGSTSYKGARGLTQILPSTATGIGCAPNWATDPKENIRCSAKYISKHIIPQIKTSEIKYVLSAYNAGPGSNAQGPSRDCPGMRRWECAFNNPEQTVCNAGSGSFEETRNYVVSATKYYNQAKSSCGN